MSCSLCGVEEETDLHIFKDLEFAAIVWAEVNPRRKNLWTGTVSWLSWVAELNGKMPFILPLIMMILWCIWNEI